MHHTIDKLIEALFYTEVFLHKIYIRPFYLLMPFSVKSVSEISEKSFYPHTVFGLEHDFLFKYDSTACGQVLNLDFVRN